MQMKSEFKVGDIVMVKSGGPKMTITRLLTGYQDLVETVRTTWFAGNNNESSDFPPEALMFPPETEPKKK